MPKIYVMCGLPFSGKTTLSLKIAEILNINRISFDETWVEVATQFGFVEGETEVEKWQYVTNVCENRIKESLRKKQSVVYDNLGATYEQRIKIKKLAKELLAQTQIIYIDISRKEVEKRREDNLKLKLRSQVSDNNFNHALEIFEIPNEEENALIFRPSENITEWINKNLITKPEDIEIDK